MDIANKVGGLVIGTGDMSELALGWCLQWGSYVHVLCKLRSAKDSCCIFIKVGSR